MKQTGIWLAAAILAATALPAAAAQLTLVREGRPTSTIVIAPGATRSAQLAAYELQWHLQQITGAIVPIVTQEAEVTGVPILVGPSPATEARGIRADFRPQEYLVKFLPQAIVLMGNDKDDRGKVDYSPDHPNRSATWPSIWDACATIYAVDDFLRDYCGVRWFSPAELGTIVPHRRTLTVAPGPTARRAPGFTSRNLWPYDPAQFEGTLRMPGAALWRPGSPEAQQLSRTAHPELYAKYPHGNIEELRSRTHLWFLRQKVGGEEVLANHTMWGYWRRFGAEPTPGDEQCWEGYRPEFFGTGYPAEVASHEPCFSSEAFLAQVVADARDYFDTGTMKRGYVAFGQKWFSVMPTDGNARCQCPLCQAQKRPERTEDGINGTFSDYTWGFVNKVAREVRKTHPEAWIINCAYGAYQGHPSFELEPNVAVDMCLSTRNWYAPAQVKADMRMLDEWKVEKGKRPLYCWVYWGFPQEVANNGRFHAFPGFFAHTAARQFRLLRDYGIEGIFYCGIGQDVENYVASQMMDNPDLGVNTILDEYFTRQYGQAGAPLRKFYEAVEATYTNPRNWPPAVASGKVMAHENREIAWKWLGTPERMARLAEYIAEADAARVTSEQRQRVELFKRNFWDYMVAGRKQYEDREALPLPRYTIPRVPDAGGEAQKADWSRAALISDFYLRGTDTPAARKLSARFVHDGDYLYLRLEDPCETAKLFVSPIVNPYDDWEIFMAKERAIPYRQICVGPTAMIQALTHGETNWIMNFRWLDHGVKVTSDITKPDLWTEWLAIPLSSVAEGGVEPGDKFHMSVLRVDSPSLTGKGLEVNCSLSFANVHEPDRLAEFTLARSEAP